jgi:hypothetical protein
VQYPSSVEVSTKHSRLLVLQEEALIARIIGRGWEGVGIACVWTNEIEGGTDRRKEKMTPKQFLSSTEISRIEDELHETLLTAQNAYQHAQAEAKRLYHLTEDVGINPDGSLALRNAARLENEALQRYLAAWEEFRDFILYRKLPQWHRHHSSKAYAASSRKR